jgi:hypothetical protein
MLYIDIGFMMTLLTIFLQSINVMIRFYGYQENNLPN